MVYPFNTSSEDTNTIRIRKAYKNIEKYDGIMLRVCYGSPFCSGVVLFFELRYFIMLDGDLNLCDILLLIHYCGDIGFF